MWVSPHLLSTSLRQAEYDGLHGSVGDARQRTSNRPSPTRASSHDQSSIGGPFRALPAHGPEACAAGSSVEQGGGTQAIAAQSGGDGDGLVLPMRDGGAASLAPLSPTRSGAPSWWPRRSRRGRPVCWDRGHPGS